MLPRKPISATVNGSPSDNEIRDDEPFLILAQLHGRQTDLRVQITLVEKHFPDPLDVIGELLAFENAGVG